MRAMALAVVVVTLGAAGAAPRCATPTEVKALKAAVLEQVLTAAKQSCRLDTDYSRFVAAYHAGMVENDRSLKRFFAARTASEGYDGYKARLAAAVSLKSLHDQNFCADAKALFDIALQRKAGPAPELIATGYENCGAPAAPKPEIAAPKPPKLVVLLHRKPPAVPPAAPSVKIAAVPRPAARPALEKPAPVLAPKLAAAAKPRASEPPLRITAPLTPLDAPQTPSAPKPAFAANNPAQSLPQPQAARQEAAFRDEDASPYAAGDPTPNAYKPGAVWVRTDLPSEPVPPARYQPRPPEPNLYLGIDGRWHVMIGHRRRWGE